MVYVGTCRNCTVRNVVWEKRGEIPYVADVTFVNMYTGQFIANFTVKGVWQGVLTSAVTTIIRETPLGKC